MEGYHSHLAMVLPKSHLNWVDESAKTAVDANILRLSAGVREWMGVFVVLTFIYYAITVIYNLYFHPLAKFPGSKIAAISQLPLIKGAILGNTWEVVEKWHHKYGPVVRIAPEEITTVSPSAWKEIYTSRPFLPKDPFSQTPPMNGADSLFTANGDTHYRMRKAFAHAFSDKALRDQSLTIQTHIDFFIRRMHRELVKTPGGKLDMAKFFGYASLDVISDLTFGESFHSLEGDNEHSWIVRIFLGAKFGSIRNSLSRFYPIDRLFAYIFLRLTAKHRKENWSLATDRIQRRLEAFERGINSGDIVGNVAEHVNEEMRKGITMKELTTNGLAVVIAGCQLPTVALATATYLMLQNPRTLNRLVEEIRTNFESEKEMDVQSTQSLPYLTAVIDETLRMHHPTPINLPRVVPPEGQMIDGQWIPGNAVMGINLQIIQNWVGNWVEPRVFNPERFLPRDHPLYDSRFDKDQKEAYYPFATGPRNCMGGKLFLAEAKLILARLLWNFELRLDNPDDADWLKQKAYLVFEPKPLIVRMREIGV